MQKISPILPIALLLSLMALLAGLWAGLLRLGWLIPEIENSLPLVHGTLMVSGFLGSLIAIERVVALRMRVLYLGPILIGIGWVLILVLPQSTIGPLGITLGSLGAVAILWIMVKREPALHTITIGIGALCWLIGNILWLSGLHIFQIVFWWAAFLVLTITGERLELSRVLRMDPVKRNLFLMTGGIFLAGVIATLFSLPDGTRLVGVGLFGLAIWLLRFDIARRNLRHPVPLTRYIARCLYAGYFWLGFAGILCVWYGAVFAGPHYDAILHSIFVGFVISMIFGHAPIILPAVLNRRLPYHPAFYASLALLHASLLLRITGDLGGWYTLRQWGGLLNEVSILLFLGMLVITLRSQKPQRVADAGG